MVGGWLFSRSVEKKRKRLHAARWTIPTSVILRFGVQQREGAAVSYIGVGGGGDMIGSPRRKSNE